MAAGAGLFESGPLGCAAGGQGRRGGNPELGLVTAGALQLGVRPRQGPADSPMVESVRGPVRPLDQLEFDTGVIGVAGCAPLPLGGWSAMPAPVPLGQPSDVSMAGHAAAEGLTSHSQLLQNLVGEPFFNR